ncbi:MAG: (Fe-S)-binding protein [Deltaproteobacteria bacterium]|nr:(Fe-S)-binding protein [Deltaproteobacteria bacterium]
MKVGLFIPCYVDQLYPDVAMATVEVLERFGVHADFPTAQTCCGQPMANSGCTGDTRPLAEAFLRIFSGYDYVVCPSGSCVSMVRHHYEEYFHNNPTFEALKARTFELCEFLVDVLKIKSVAGKFPHKVGLHQSCHGLRELHLGPPTELMNKGTPNKVKQLLAELDGIEFTSLQRPDECCGFGGTFAVAEEAVSCMMGQDRLADHQQAGTHVLTAADMSCLMHLEGLLRRQGKDVAVMHVAQILAGREPQFASQRGGTSS